MNAFVVVLMMFAPGVPAPVLATVVPPMHQSRDECKDWTREHIRSMGAPACNIGYDCVPAKEAAERVQRAFPGRPVPAWLTEVGA